MADFPLFAALADLDDLLGVDYDLQDEAEAQEAEDLRALTTGLPARPGDAAMIVHLIGVLWYAAGICALCAVGAWWADRK